MFLLILQGIRTALLAQGMQKALAWQYPMLAGALIYLNTDQHL